MIKIDLHTHSIASRDGGITATQYTYMIETGALDYVAITDHNKISFAQELQKKLGDHIIVGEEINTTEGELIGLFLKKEIARDQTPEQVVRAIKEQGGLVYVPHPFETVRSGVSEETLERIMKDVDIIEVFNGRAVFQNKGPKASMTARLHRKPGAASSDAHGVKGLATTYAVIDEAPTVKNLPDQLHTAKLTMKHPPLKTLLYPKANRLRKGWKRD